jgi:hypothetical protein
LIHIKPAVRGKFHARANPFRSSGMSVYEWARQETRQSLDMAQEVGFDPGLSLRALLSAVVQQSKAVRNAEDLADELRFLAENLDDNQDYGFMRP